MIRVGLEQGVEQGRAGAGFAHRYRVQPDHRPGHLRCVAAHAFAQMLQVFRLAARAPCQAQADKGRGNIPDGGVKVSENQGDG